MMVTAPYKLLLTSAVILSVSTAGAGFLVKRLANVDAAWNFLTVAGCIVCLILALQAVQCICVKGRLYLYLLFLASFSLSLCWLMMCLVLPVFWIPSITIAIKSALGLVLVALAGANLRMSYLYFSTKWSPACDVAFGKSFDRKNGTIDWDKILAPMKLKAEIYVPGVPERLNSVISVLLIVLMFSGLALRATAPTYAVFAWGVPFSILAMIVVQIIGMRISQAARVLILETQVSQPICYI